MLLFRPNPDFVLQIDEFLTLINELVANQNQV